MNATASTKVEAKERLIVALDLENAEQARATADALDGVVEFFKIGLTLQLAPGSSNSSAI